MGLGMGTEMSVFSADICKHRNMFTPELSTLCTVCMPVHKTRQEVTLGLELSIEGVLQNYSNWNIMRIDRCLLKLTSLKQSLFCTYCKPYKVLLQIQIEVLHYPHAVYCTYLLLLGFLLLFYYYNSVYHYTLHTLTAEIWRDGDITANRSSR